MLFLLFIAVNSTPAQEKRLRIAFYNVENLFDCSKESGKEDDEFLPTSLRRWTIRRWNYKNEQLARSIASLGEWETPAVIGLCEVENATVLRQLTRYSSLKSHNYRYIITESPDIRGINVAILYNPRLFSVIGQQCFRIELPPQERPTRDILHVTGITSVCDTVDLFVCHLPSKLRHTAGENRRLVLQTLRRKADSTALIRTNPHIVIMGDFNTHYTDRALKKELTDSGKYIFPFNQISRNEGSYKFNGKWELIDHFYLNAQWYNAYSTNPPCAVIHSPRFLLEKDRKYGGLKPFRTWNGKRYQGGFSDHLPIYLDIRPIASPQQAD